MDDFETLLFPHTFFNIFQTVPWIWKYSNCSDWSLEIGTLTDDSEPDIQLKKKNPRTKKTLTLISKYSV